MKITVASGKGGTGKTLIATALALASGDCTYVDLDVEEPNGYIFLKPTIEKTIPVCINVPEIDEKICTFCGECARACAFNALVIIPAGRKHILFPELCHSCGACSYVCPVEGAIRETGSEIGKIRIGRAGRIRFVEGRLNVGRPSGVPLISRIIQNCINDDELAIIDAAPGTACPVVESMAKSDYVLLVTEPTPFGLNDLVLTLELVESLGKETGLIINKDNGDSTIIDDFLKGERPVHTFAGQSTEPTGTPGVATSVKCRHDASGGSPRAKGRLPLEPRCKGSKPVFDAGRDTRDLQEEGAGMSAALVKKKIPVITRIPYSLAIQKAYSRGIPLTTTIPEITPTLKAIIDTIVKEK
ncbi:MAG: hypothetical protein GY765_31155 [bacterium]|nr:hypothetical protein [bacterium]